MTKRLLLALAALLLTPAPAPAQHWVGTWASSQQVPEPNNALPPEQLTDVTLRQLMRVTLGGSRLRIRISNVFGTTPLRIDHVRIARTPGGDSARILPGGASATFAGRGDVIVPAGAELSSDPIAFPLPPLATVAVTMHVPAPPAQQTSHPGSRATSWLLHGDRVDDLDLPGAQGVEHWFLLSGIDIEAPAAAAIVTFGDSITDGRGVTHSGNNRWPDVLAERLQADPRTRRLAVLNHGVGGGRVLDDGAGPNALARFERDVLAMPGVRYVLILEGVNDLGTFTRGAPQSPEAHAELVRRLIQAYAEMIRRGHERGLTIIGGTIIPFGGFALYHPTGVNEADRQAVNAWIRAPGHFDAVVDFDALLRDPAHPERMREGMDSGDHIHPSLAGYRAMGEAVPLALFVRRR
ncbi:MAG: SGNH/GDSL hydrolase family protein [Sphingomonadaceae bacterium]|nr:SGNH/GDSL hydrolase family protein [Sphingomonadaceae bacterium]